MKGSNINKRHRSQDIFTAKFRFVKYRNVVIPCCVCIRRSYISTSLGRCELNHASKIVGKREKLVNDRVYNHDFMSVCRSLCTHKINKLFRVIGLQVAFVCYGRSVAFIKHTPANYPNQMIAHINIAIVNIYLSLIESLGAHY